jgi:hypothetical protein
MFDPMNALYAAEITAGLFAARSAFWQLGRTFGYTDPRWFHKMVVPGIRPLYRNVYMPLRDWKAEITEGSKGGTAGWLSPLEAAMTLNYRPGAALLGRLRVLGLPMNQYLGARSERHRLIIAGARSGKTTFLASELALRSGPAMVVDPKLQLVEILATKLAAQGKSVKVLAPYGGLPEGIAPSSWDLFAQARRFEKRHGIDAIPGFFMRAADAMILPFSPDPFWPGASKMVITGVGLHLYTTEPNATLPRLYQVLMTGDQSAPIKDGKRIDPVEWLLFRMSQNEAFQAIPNAAETLVRVAKGNTFGSVLITIAEQLKWLADPLVARSLSRDDIDLEHLKTGEGELNLFLGMPVGDLKGPMAAYARLLVSTGLFLMERTPPRKPKHRTAFIIDEVAVAIEAIAQAAPVMAGYGVELILATQGVQLLSKIYPNEWKELIGNAEFVYWMGLNDPESPVLLQQILGTVRREERIKPGWFSKQPERTNMVEFPLMDAERIRRFLRPSSGRMIITRFAGRPIKATNVPYYSNVPTWLHDPDPDWGERWPKSFTRNLTTKHPAKANF